MDPPQYRIHPERCAQLPRLHDLRAGKGVHFYTRPAAMVCFGARSPPPTWQQKPPQLTSGPYAQARWGSCSIASPPPPLAEQRVYSLYTTPLSPNRGSQCSRVACGSMSGQCRAGQLSAARSRQAVVQPAGWFGAAGDARSS
eukprot:5716535-Prymnesium_polylepis.1